MSCFWYLVGSPVLTAGQDSLLDEDPGLGTASPARTFRADSNGVCPHGGTGQFTWRRRYWKLPRRALSGGRVRQLVLILEVALPSFRCFRI